jgi:hypothetical protein
MENLIARLLANEIAQDRAEAIEIIESMQEEVAEGEDIQDVLSLWDLDFDDAIDLLLV